MSHSGDVWDFLWVYIAAHFSKQLEVGLVLSTELGNSLLQVPPASPTLADFLFLLHVDKMMVFSCKLSLPCYCAVLSNRAFPEDKVAKEKK